jgi:hypothetical protein
MAIMMDVMLIARVEAGWDNEGGVGEVELSYESPTLGYTFRTLRASRKQAAVPLWVAMDALHAFQSHYNGGKQE